MRVQHLVALGPSLAAASVPDLNLQPGTRAQIPAWHLQTSAQVSDPRTLSVAGIDTSAWHYAATPACTILGCLLDAGALDDTQLWYSDNLAGVDERAFSVPWIYRAEFGLARRHVLPERHVLEAKHGFGERHVFTERHVLEDKHGFDERHGFDGRHVFIETHGISSGADLWLNGRRIADRSVQSGAFGGRAYHVTSLVAESNALVVKVYPSDARYDLVQTFVDWNPHPPDNGTGVWRPVEVRMTGPVALGAMSVSIEMGEPVKMEKPVMEKPVMEKPVEIKAARVVVEAPMQNLENHDIRLSVGCAILDPAGDEIFTTDSVVTLKSGESHRAQVSHLIDRPHIWWPRQWGDQPLYTAVLTLTVSGTTSDTTQRRFGIRTVSSRINAFNDTIFAINGHDFQVLGGGYAPDHFYRWDARRFAAIAQHTIALGLNTIRLEGSLEHPALYDAADELGLMLLPGWVCCSAWEAWRHNADLELPLWNASLYRAARASMAHEAAVMQTHPSILGFLVGSDSWPDDAAADVYLDELAAARWQTPVIASASKRGFPSRLGPSGMKMDGPYDWVPPNYWFDVDDGVDDDTGVNVVDGFEVGNDAGALGHSRMGAAFGFGSELGAGVGTPELGSLRRFLSAPDLHDLWTASDTPLFHMSPPRSVFATRRLYNTALAARYGNASSLHDYLLWAQMADYEATRAQHEAYAARWQAPTRPATGSVYWMLNSAWPSLHWALFDAYMHPAGAYFGAKTALRAQHVVYDAVRGSVWLVNRSLRERGRWRVDADVVRLDGTTLAQRRGVEACIGVNSAREMGRLFGRVEFPDVALLRLVLRDDKSVLSRGVYWLPRRADVLDWANSTWYYTPVKRFADLSALRHMQRAAVAVRVVGKCVAQKDQPLSMVESFVVVVENTAAVPAVFLRLNVVDARGGDINPVFWSDNYVTLWPRETMQLEVNFTTGGSSRLHLSGVNVDAIDLGLS